MDAIKGLLAAVSIAAMLVCACSAEVRSSSQEVGSSDGSKPTGPPGLSEQESSQEGPKRIDTVVNEELGFVVVEDADAEDLKAVASANAHNIRFVVCAKALPINGQSVITLFPRHHEQLNNIVVDMERDGEYLNIGINQPDPWYDRWWLRMRIHLVSKPSIESCQVSRFRDNVGTEYFSVLDGTVFAHQGERGTMSFRLRCVLKEEITLSGLVTW